MVLIVDSREKWTLPNSKDSHIKSYLDRHGIAYTVRKLDVGDYAIEGQPGITVDRKQSLSEVATNLLNKKDSGRFWREIRRAHESGVQLVVLVESGPSVLNIQDVPKWKSKYSPVTGRRLLDEMVRCEMAYGVIWRFCSKRSTAKRILDILSGEI